MARETVTPIQKRFSDVDIFRHVNNVAQQMYFDVGKTDYYRTVLGGDVLFDNLRMVTVSTSTSYMSQIRHDDDIAVTTFTERIGDKSMTLFQRIVRSEPDGSQTVCSESRSVLVAFDFAAQEAVRVPDAWREAMER
ncbi:MAG: acyl-CoA thioesterase [Alistipes sp.]|nr:acyl-CoA thioesterase [Alistipes sp.]MDE6857165.1 acyl-CoA thioesterase [Alistipes sp.]